MLFEEIMKDLHSICGECKLKNACIEDACLVYRLKQYLIENESSLTPRNDHA